MSQGTAIRKGAPASDVQKRLMEIVDAIENGATVELKEVRIARMLNDRITTLESALSDCVTHMKTAGSPEAVRAAKAARRLLRDA